MSVSSEVRKAGPFLGNGTAASFPFGFKVFEADDVKVVQADAGGVETPLTPGVDYSVTLNPEQESAPGGSVVLNTPLPDGERLAITSSMANLQPITLTNQGGFYPEIINAGLDRLTSGTIEIGGRDVTDVEPKDRDIAMVFQSYALYPTMSVRSNMEFGLRMRGKPLSEIRPLVEEKPGRIGDAFDSVVSKEFDYCSEFCGGMSISPSRAAWSLFCMRSAVSPWSSDIFVSVAALFI